MAQELPDALVALLKDTILCRESQLRQLCLLLGSQEWAPQTLVIHGVEATAKSLSVNALLNKLETPSTVVRCRECVTTRHLLERSITLVKESLQSHPTAPPPKETDGRCENLSAFVTELQVLLSGRQTRFTLVLDNIDEQREASPSLLPALARLGEMIPNLTTVLITHRAPSSSLRNSNALYLHYPPYTRDESISILESSVFPLGTLGPDARTSDGRPSNIQSEEDTRWLWRKFVGHCWDSLGQGAARDLISFRRVCEKLWTPFIQPVVDGQYGVRGSQELAKLLVRNRSLMQKEDVLVGSLTTNFDGLSTTKDKPDPPTWTLPYVPTLLLTAAYLASTTHPRHDISLFSRSSNLKRRRRAGTTATSANAKRKISRRLLGPQPFVFERMLAIFHAVTDGIVKGGSGDVYSQFASLVKLGLVGKVGGGDVLDPSGKWRCLVGEELVKGMAKGKGVDLGEWVIE